MRAQIKLGSTLGVKIGVHYSWLIIALLITLSLRAHFRVHNSQWGESVIWATAIMTALLFFATIVVHELSHASVAKAHGLPVRSITLFALGGIAEVEEEATDARTELDGHYWSHHEFPGRHHLPGRGAGVWLDAIGISTKSVAGRAPVARFTSTCKRAAIRRPQ